MPMPKRGPDEVAARIRKFFQDKLRQWKPHEEARQSFQELGFEELPVATVLEAFEKEFDVRIPDNDFVSLTFVPIRAAIRFLVALVKRRPLPDLLAPSKRRHVA